MHKSDGRSGGAFLSDAKRALLAKRLRGEAAGAAKPRDAITRRELAGPPPLSFAQERMWVLDQLEPGSTVYNIAAVSYMEGPLDVGVLERTLREILRRHEALRTFFPRVDGEPVQALLDPSWFRVELEDVPEMPEAERDAYLLRRTREEGTRPFDLATGPLFRVRLYRLSPVRHVFQTIKHHIVTDGWSMGALTHELEVIYKAFARGEPSPLPELRIQYRDYAAWQREYLTGETLRRQVDYWKEHLAGVPNLELPTDRPRPPVESHRGAVHRFLVPAEVTAGLNALSRREGVTLNMTITAAWAILLARYSGQDDFAVGTLIGNRNRAETEELIGYFVNTAALRMDLSGDPTYRELLRRVRGTLLDADAHQDLPFDRVVEELRPPRDLGRHPVFQVMFFLHAFVVQHAPMPNPDLGDVSFAPFDPESGVALQDTGAAKFDLGLAMLELGGVLTSALEYATDLFDEATVRGIVDHLVVLLASVAAGPDACIWDLPMASAGELRALEARGAARPDLPADATVLESFQAQAARTPGASAVRSGAEALTYAELDARAERLADRLRALGVAPGDRVGVALERSPELVAAMLAAWKAGAVYVPLDPAYPRERLAFILADAAPRVLVTETRLAAGLPEFASGIVAVDTEDASALSHSRTAALPHSSSPAYLIYTSGSTGTPKAVAVSHGALATTLAASGAAFGFGAEDVVPALASPAFDISLWETLSPLLAGGTALLVPRERVADAAAVLESVRDATVLHGVPALMRETVRAARERGAPPRLRALFVGGDAVPPELLAEMREAFPGAAVHVLYGPTEAAVICASYPVPREGEVVGHPIGAPLGNAALSVRDPRGRPSPLGVPGELWIGGASLAEGYLGRAELTAEKFVVEDGTRWYRSGDRARWRADGTLEWMGRTDRQVKLRGFRIEPGEVEAALTRLPEVRDAAVEVREDRPGERRLVAYVVAEPGSGDADPERMRARLGESLPDYMVPSAFVPLGELPLTPNGKLDRAALPAPEAAAAGAREHVPPRGPVEEALAEIWAEVLGRERVGARDDFFALGGHSLMATQVISRVRDRLGAELQLREMFEASTLEAFARRVEAAAPAAPAAALAGAAATATEGGDGAPAFPLSFAQQRLWFLHQMTPESTAYNVTGAHHLRGRLDAAALERALDEVRRRHDSLRTVFRVRGGEPVQVVLPWRPEPLPLTDVSEMLPAEREAEADRRVAEMVGTPFDLAEGPLVRAELVRLGDEEHVLAFGMHHVVSDGWSMGVFNRELRTLYEAFAAGLPSPLPELEVQYPDFAVWQREQLAGEVVERQAAFWRDALRGAPTLDLPTDRPRPRTQTFRGAAEELLFPRELAGRLRALGERERATPFMVLMAAWQLLLARWSGQDDVVVGTPVAGRNRREIEGLIGFFVNTLAIRVDLSGRPDFRELVRRVREASLAAFAHQDLPFEKIVEELKPERDPSRPPLFQVTFALQNAPGGAMESPGLEWGGWGGEGRTAKYDLSLVLVDTPEGLAVALEYNTDLFDRATARRMIAQLRTVLESVAADPAVRVGDVPLLAPGEREMLAGWSASGAPEAPARSIPELFAEQAARTPDAPAVSSPGVTLTYAELDRRSHALARALRERGVRPETPVALCVERSAEMVVAVLGILRAGGVFVPLDPDYPAERLAFMLADSGARLLLTDGAAGDRLAAFAGETFALKPAPSPPGPLSPASGRKGEHDTSEGEDRQRGDSPLPERGRVAALRPPGGGAPADASSVSLDHLAYVIYTSGSTGQPKGVAVTHGALAGTLLAARGSFGIGEGDVMPSLASFAFDIWLFEALLPLLSGGSVRVVPRERVVDVAALVEELEGATVLHAVPALMRRVVDEVAAARGTLPGLRRAFVGGDAVPPELPGAMREVFPGAEVRVLYGPTEGTIICAAHHARGGEDGGRHLLGRPLGKAPLYVLDGAGEPAPVGVPGELCIGGAAAARGYLGRAALTAGTFVPDALSGRSGARMYRTGDRARWGADGVLEFLGRIDQQVKLRGFRIEPGEVEARLAEHPGVREAVVLVRDDGSGEKMLVGYVVPSGDGVGAAELREHLSARLPEYMVPGALVVLDALPLTPNGKVDRGALPAPDGIGAAREWVAPRTPTEEALAEIWAETLRIERVGAHDDFFALGGHSLIATQVVSRVRDRLGAAVQLRELFEASTLEGFARRVDAGRAPERDDAPIGAQERAGRGRRVARGPRG